MSEDMSELIEKLQMLDMDLQYITEAIPSIIEKLVKLGVEKVDIESMDYSDLKDKYLIDD